jgi:adenine-specific DNA-methyltransferase
MQENPRFLSEQLITYLGNKRALLQFIGNGLDRVRSRLGKEKISTFDVFSGSGIVSRYLKQYSSLLVTNDLERYATLINRCYLTNREDLDEEILRSIHAACIHELENTTLEGGLVAELYAPADDADIVRGERVFYTTRNARYLDTARKIIEGIPEAYRPYLLGPLLSEASVHANTSGVFKGFYKNSDTGIGKFGGNNGDALFRIRGDINLPYPVFSNFSCETEILCGDANLVCDTVPEVDVAYLDPPYNQHPYGSNYFMLNVLHDYQRPKAVSAVSGIPGDWNRSLYNSRPQAYPALSSLVGKIRAKFLIISFNSEGFITLEDMSELLGRFGKVEILETKYNAFRGSRNLGGRSLHVKEYLYLLEKN